jgi:hypothetical protein
MHIEINTDGPQIAVTDKVWVLTGPFSFGKKPAVIGPVEVLRMHLIIGVGPPIVEYAFGGIIRTVHETHIFQTEAAAKAEMDRRNK